MVCHAGITVVLIYLSYDNHVSCSCRLSGPRRSGKKEHSNMISTREPRSETCAKNIGGGSIKCYLISMAAGWFKLFNAIRFCFEILSLLSIKQSLEKVMFDHVWLELIYRISFPFMRIHVAPLHPPPLFMVLLFLLPPTPTGPHPLDNNICLHLKVPDSLVVAVAIELG